MRTIRQQVRDAKRDAWREAKECYPWVWSRGAWIATLNAHYQQCDPYPGADPLAWDGTMAQLQRVIADIEANHPHVATITIEGGYDGGERFDDRKHGCYEPWVASWHVDVWTRPAGCGHALEKRELESTTDRSKAMTTTTPPAYQVFPVADEHCDRLATDREPLAVADSYEAAEAAASELSGEYPYGVGILETATGAIDVGFGLGVQADVEEEAAPTITDTQIRQLWGDAGWHGDYAMMAICQIALTGTFDLKLNRLLDDEDRAIVARFADRAAARAELARVLAERS